MEGIEQLSKPEDFFAKSAAGVNTIEGKEQKVFWKNCEGVTFIDHRGGQTEYTVLASDQRSGQHLKLPKGTELWCTGGRVEEENS